MYQPPVPTASQQMLSATVSSGPANHGGIIHQEYLGQDVNGWLVQWRQKKHWQIRIPLIKECKKRRESFAEFYQSILFKAPYKYHVNVICSGMTLEEQVFAQLGLNFENGESIPHSDTTVLSNGTRELKIVKFEKSNFAHQSLEVTIGPFQFNVCSFRQDGRKFRLVIHLFSSILNIPRLMCSVISPPFTIRAKKPIKNPGSRRKRGRAGAGPTAGQPTPKKRRSNPVRPADAPKTTARARPPCPVNIPPPATLPTNFMLSFPPIAPPRPFQPMPMGIQPPSLFAPPAPGGGGGGFAVAAPQSAHSRLHPHGHAHGHGHTHAHAHGHARPPQHLLPPSVSGVPGLPSKVIPRRPGQQIDLFDFLLSEQEEPEEKQKSLTNRIVSEYSAMDSNHRIELLRKLLEISFPHELEYIRGIFFQRNREGDPTGFTDMDKLVSDDDRFGDDSPIDDLS